MTDHDADKGRHPDDVEDARTEAADPAHRSEALAGTEAGWRIDGAVREARSGWIGPYRIGDLLGEGGMGSVFRAEQTHPIRRTVAVKLIRASVTTERMIRRFEAECQALALMDHPSIAHVFDAGTTERGEPWVAMEYVEGVDLSTYCDQRRLSIRQRLELFCAICAGVQHAHQKGVVHRDLKPSNVLVADNGSPTPKIIDFGIAKSMDEPLTEATLLTGEGLLGTPCYMSPERLEGSADVDTRADVYSLGVMLYELLAGTLPFDWKPGRLTGAPKLLAEDDAVRPSTKVTTLDADRRARVAEARATDPERLSRRLRGDLDWITVKAMAADRNRRYDSVASLAADVGRYLANEPVLATPPTVVYRTRKFLRRHTVGVVASALVVLALLAGITGTTIQAQRANREAERATREAEAARQTSDFLVSVFEVSDPSRSLGETVTARELLDRGARRLDAELAEQPLVRARLAETMGTAYRQLGLYDEAEGLLSIALDIARAELEPGHANIATALHNLGLLHLEQGRFEDAERVLVDATNVNEAGSRSKSLANAKVLAALGSLYARQQRFEEAREFELASLELCRHFADDGCQVSALHVLASVAFQQQDLEGARSYLESTIEILERSLDPADPRLAGHRQNLALVYGALGNTEEKARILREAEGALSGVVDDDHPTLVRVRANLAGVLHDQGKDNEAESYYRQAIMSFERRLGAGHPETAIARHNLGRILCDTERADEGIELMRSALEGLEAVFESNHGHVMTVRSGLISCLESAGRNDEARALAAWTSGG